MFKKIHAVCYLYKNIQRKSSTITRMQNSLKKSLSLEVYPPSQPKKIGGLFKNIAHYIEHGYENFSVVNKNPQRTELFVTMLLKEFPFLQVIPHLTVLGNTVEEINKTLKVYRLLNIKKIFCILGDETYTRDKLPDLSNVDFLSNPPIFRSKMTVFDLIYLVKQAGFEPLAACYPERHPLCLSDQENIENALKKQDAGCTALISQSVYTYDVFFDYIRKARQNKVGIPIIPSVMPLIKTENIIDFTKKNNISVPIFLLGHRTEIQKFQFYATLIERLENMDGRVTYSTLNDFNLFTAILNKICNTEKHSLKKPF